MKQIATPPVLPGVPSSPIRRSRTTLADFSGTRSSGDAYWEAIPEDVADTVRIMRHARTNGMPLRVRGQGHSLNGTSLPSADEVLLRTHQLTHVRLRPDGKLTAGGGAVVWHLEAWLRRNGRRLPLLHDGGQPAPSLAGWIAAGGLASGAAEQGGLWTVIEELVLVRPTGDVVRVRRDHELFPWLFGSMGQLGVIVEVTLQTLPGENGVSGSREREGWLEPRATEAPLGAEAQLQWFNVLVDPARRGLASALLYELERRHRKTYDYHERFAYEVAEGFVRAPLIWSAPGPLWVVGTWGRAKHETGDAVQRFERDFAELVARQGFGRYIQAEIGSGEDRFRAAFGPNFEEFRRWKDRLDPPHLLNRGSVFTPPVA